MDIKKLKQIADRHELDIIDKNECILLNSYKNQDKYKIFSVENKETQKNFYIEFINELSELLTILRSGSFLGSS